MAQAWEGVRALTHLLDFFVSSRVMKEMEAMAAGPELDASFVTLNTLDGEVSRQPEFWAKMGVAPGRNNEEWYTRLGYEAFRRGIPRYPSKAVDGTEFLAEAVVSFQRP